MKVFIILFCSCWLQTALAKESFSEFTLRKGETLGGLSFRIHGTHKKWKEIYQDNLSVIQDPDHVPEGTVLKVRNTKTSLQIVSNKSDQVPKSFPLANDVAGIFTSYTEMELP